MRNLNQAQPSMVFPAAPANSIGCGRPARSGDSEPHPEPASREACSTTELYSAGGQAGGEWRVPCDELGQSISTLSTDRTVATNTQHAKDESLGGVLRAATEPWRAAVSEGERAIALSIITLPSEDVGDGPHHITGTVSDRLMDPRCDRGATDETRTLCSLRALKSMLLLSFTGM